MREDFETSRETLQHRAMTASMAFKVVSSSCTDPTQQQQFSRDSIASTHDFVDGSDSCCLKRSIRLVLVSDRDNGSAKS